ncbi:hypothetical protein [Streptomyces zagrosensis]|uniref:Uncharacterized protein n=1 Tax=Streptomyces zagrosensis TaxID=1042984 RepID=A0A7W9Q6U0_9ACTN|nr:hypothetical protein [Streptomyces zagrosensis]MBB5934691.1 hypothetical protein [Streptomyces zagrosensis]
MERPVTPKRKRSVRGPRAIRVPKGGKDYRVYAPCAFCRPASRPAPPDSTGPWLYEDEAAERLLCSVDKGAEAEGGQGYHVRDGQGDTIGTIHRLPPSKRIFKHTWRIEQVGHPEIIGRNQWASGDTKDIVEHGVTKVFMGALQSAVTSLGSESSDHSEGAGRTLEWRSDGHVVMVSQGSKWVTIKADWMDRRLAFAFALIGDD